MLAVERSETALCFSCNAEDGELCYTEGLNPSEVCGRKEKGEQAYSAISPSFDDSQQHPHVSWTCALHASKASFVFKDSDVMSWIWWALHNRCMVTASRRSKLTG